MKTARELPSAKRLRPAWSTCRAPGASLDNSGRFTAGDFDTLPDWSEPEAAAALGTAVSERSGEVLRNIETTILKP